MRQGSKQNGGDTWEKTLGGIGFCCIQPRAKSVVNRIREVPLGYHDNMILDTLSMPHQSLSQFGYHQRSLTSRACTPDTRMTGSWKKAQFP